MTCEWCGGKGTMPMIDPWVMRENRRACKPVVTAEIPDIPCPGCHEDEADAWLAAKIERDGRPYTDNTTAFRWRLYRRARDGRQIAVPQPASAP